tara:strand:+ start:441 stop:638 length:198 start_codon:yes stop_codon:yes gene_type:complete
MLSLFLKNLAQISFFTGVGFGVVLVTAELMEYSTYFVIFPAVLVAFYLAYDKAKSDYEIKQLRDS